MYELNCTHATSEPHLTYMQATFMFFCATSVVQITFLLILISYDW